jgi:hypothetical protein
LPFFRKTEAAGNREGHGMPIESRLFVKTSLIAPVVAFT